MVRLGLPTDNILAPVGPFAASFDTLISNSFITGADPFYPKDPANDLFHGEITTLPAGAEWQGPVTVAGRTLFTNGETNQVFFSIELHKVNADALALQQCFDVVLNELFNW